MWAACMYMIVFLRKQRLCVVSEKLKFWSHWNKEIKHLENICSQDFWEQILKPKSFCENHLDSSLTENNILIYIF